MDDPATFATIDEHLPGAFAFTIKVTTSGALFRILPHRDPDQPRFWCVVMVRCAPGGLVDDSEAGRIACRNLRRDELAETMGVIRTDLEGWLAEPSRAELRAWLLACPALPPGDPSFVLLPRGRPATPGRSPRQPRSESNPA